MVRRRMGVLGCCVIWVGGISASIDAVAQTSNVPQPAATPSTASAAGGLEEIVVTARKQSESMNDVPVAVSVITPAEIRNNDATDLQKLAELTPQVFAGEVTTGTGVVLSIRGIGSSPFDAGIDQSVSVVVDGIQLSRGRIIQEALFDLRQVEVLEGPQALFFGKNSPAGVIALHSEDPTNTLQGYVRTGYEFEADERFGEGAISGPITDTLRYRIAFRADAQDGYIRNIAPSGPDPFTPGLIVPGAWSASVPGSEHFAGRLALDWTPWDNFDAILKVTGGDTYINDGAGNSSVYCANGAGQTVFGVPVPPSESACYKSFVKSAGALPPMFAVNYPYADGGVPYLHSNLGLASLTLTETLKDATLTSTTGYYRQNVSDAANSDGTPWATIYDAEHEAYTLFTQELRAVTTFDFPVNYTGGLYYENFHRPHFNAPFLLDEGLNPASGNYTNNEQEIQNDGATYSAFAQARWEIISTLEAAAGARWTGESKNVVYNQISVNPGNILGPFHPVGEPFGGHYWDHNISPEATLTWHPEQGQTLYVAYKQGYKSGGFANTAVIPATETLKDLEFGPESSKGAEIGYKAEMLDHSLRFDVTAYRYNYSGLQVSAFDAATISYLLSNAASSRTQGIEGNVKWLAMTGLTISSAMGFNHARYVDFPNAQCSPGQTAATGCVNGVQNLSGQPLGRAPDFVGNVGADYSIPIAEWKVDVGADADYTSSYQVSDTDDPNEVQNAFWKLNASVRVTPPGGHLDVSLVGRDLTNTRYLIYSSGAAGGGTYNYNGYYNRPREIMLEAAYHY